MLAYAMTAVISVVATLVVVLIARNVTAGEKKIQYSVAHRYPVADPRFAQAVGNLLGPPLVGGNDITALHDGEQIFPAMLQAIRGAARSITFETFIYWEGDIGRAFADALSERAQAG